MYEQTESVATTSCQKEGRWYEQNAQWTETWKESDSK